VHRTGTNGIGKPVVAPLANTVSFGKWPLIGMSVSLPAGSAAGSYAGISFTHGPILGFFAQRLHRSRSNLAGRRGP